MHGIYGPEIITVVVLVLRALITQTVLLLGVWGFGGCGFQGLRVFGCRGAGFSANRRPYRNVRGLQTHLVSPYLMDGHMRQAEKVLGHPKLEVTPPASCRYRCTNKIL